LKELKALAGKLPLPAIVGLCRPREKRFGQIHCQQGCAAVRRSHCFEQSKMLLPTYDVFDESRYFQPAEKQSAYGFGSELLGITICEDVWNDKNFWPTCATNAIR